MKRIREALRMHQDCNISLRQTAKALGVSRPVLSDYLNRCNELGLDYQKSCRMTDEQIEQLFYQEKKIDPRLEELQKLFPQHEKDLKKTGVTKQLLWEEYKTDNINPYSYSQYCYHFHEWQKSKDVYMRIHHKAGDKLFVDYTGKKLEIIDPQSGEVTPVEVFVSTLGASKLIYVEATYSQKKHDFIKSQINTLKYIGGVPAAIVPDCLKSAVTKGHKYEPDINPEYQEFASHYETAMLPARPYHPKDKALVEGAVRIVYQNIFAPLRDRHFFSIEALNGAIREKLEMLNNKIMKEYGCSRWELFNELEKDILKPLPVDHFQLRKHKHLKVAYDYHVYIRDINHHYSVPFQYCGMDVDVYYTSSNVEIYHNNCRIALHIRKRTNKKFTTAKEHMPEDHRFIDGWTPDKFLTWAAGYGPYVHEMIITVLESKQHPEQGYKTSLGILNLAREFDKERLNKACQKALYYQTYNYKFIKNILENSQEDLLVDKPKESLPDHDNIRGKYYYMEEE